LSGFYDVYVLAPGRTAGTIDGFLTRFAPAREPSADEYEIPQNADAPVGVFRTAEELIAHCVANPAEPHAIYWRSLLESDPRHAMAFFTPDGGLILGLSAVADPERWLHEMLAETGATLGLVAFEERPPDTVNEFITLAAKHDEREPGISCRVLR
jgi:hypothetical protein